MRLAEIVLWGSLSLAIYAYVLYPLVLWLLTRWTRKLVTVGGAMDAASWPDVTLAIRAHCDEQVIVKRLQNAVELDYQPGKLQILVGCVGEDDLTGLLTRSFNTRRVESVQFSTRDEAFVLNATVRQARGEVVVFSDARTLMRPDAIRQLAGHFRDPRVGLVSGKLLAVDVANAGRFDGRLSRVEGLIRHWESRLEFIPDVAGGFYAIRKDLFAPQPEQSSVDNLAIAVEARRKGFRLLYDERAVAITESRSNGDEAHREARPRVETVNSGRPDLPSLDFRRGLLPLVFWLHQFVRRLCPAFLIAAFVGNACLANDPFYLHFLLFHELVYIAALIVVYATAGGRGQRLIARVRSLIGKSDASGRRRKAADSEVPVPAARTVA